MQIFDTLKKTEYPTAIALGFFDGVHIGHRDVIKKCVSMSAKLNTPAVLTFKSSPSDSFSADKKPLLTTNQKKFELLSELGVEDVFCVDFEQIKDMSAETFVRDVLHSTLNAQEVVTGFNYHFGKGGNATADDMITLCKKYGIKAQKCDPVMFDNAPVSSTRIRECIMSGDIHSANEMLGYNFSVEGEITSGNHIGATLKAPTINQRLSDTLVMPKFGVYATKVFIDDKQYFGATNIGKHPTVGECYPVCETHLLNYNGELLYGKNARTELLNFVRPEQKFSDTAELKSQIENDKQTITLFFRNTQ